jgi:ubiquinone/menaquinone biosynthesis C-methylase UbiE
MKRIWLSAALLLVAALPAAAQTATTKTESADEKRERNLKLADVLDALALSPGSQVADIGAGEGFYVPRLAKRVGASGRVYAVDINDKFAIPKLKELVEKQSLSNVTVVHSEPADPKVPENSLDAALMVISYHEIEPYQEMLKHVMADLKPGGRLVVVDMTPKKTRTRPRADQTKNHVIAPELAESEFRAAGFEIVSRRDDFIDQPDEEETKWMMICRKPPVK